MGFAIDNQNRVLQRGQHIFQVAARALFYIGARFKCFGRAAQNASQFAVFIRCRKRRGRDSSTRGRRRGFAFHHGR
jgi:hypothetical protein